MNILTYFKRVKEPISRPKDAIPIKRETLLYLLICIAASVSSSFLSSAMSSRTLREIFSIAMIIFAVGIIYFGFMLYAMSRAIKRMRNLTCNKCGTQFSGTDCTSWKEKRHYWVKSGSNRSTNCKLCVNVEFTFKCPECGESKSFVETLSSGSITDSSTLLNNNLVSVQDVVSDYLNGTIHV